MQREIRKTEFWKQPVDEFDDLVAPGRYEIVNLRHVESHNYG